ncbi:asparagine synthetase domain-containing protein CG17486 [Belonocnema kinseyi]|uniref:asparagine synthetase domain-containing protein CG17486 n=1 Tax=Belonocnema kinseyi TaxID=2817044 RepID=UPI00143D7023|nr:asparagine synthetase domain-containing protein CG17486 [Belonocnema kinseyi]
MGFFQIIIYKWKISKERISSRGPDNLLEKSVSLSDDFSGYFAASVLWTQGSKLTVQPSIDEEGNILLWNGDIFSGSLVGTNNESDTLIVLKAFKSTGVESTLLQIKGPYSFVYFQKSTEFLYFGRDLLGRHSLLINFNQVDNCLTLASVTSRKFKNTIELPAIGIFVLKLSEDFNLACFPWRNRNENFDENFKKLENLLNIDIKIGDVLSPIREKSFDPSSPDLKYFHDDSLDFRNFEQVMESLLERREIYERVEKLESLLNDSVKARVEKQPSFCKNCIKLFLKGEEIQCEHAKIAILFSGGLDSSILSVVADKFVNENESIDLINVAFEKAMTNSKNSRNQDEIYNVPDRKTGRLSYSELESICPKRNWNFIETDKMRILPTLVLPLAVILNSLEEAIAGVVEGKPSQSGENLQNLFPPLKTTFSRFAFSDSDVRACRNRRFTPRFAA